MELIIVIFDQLLECKGHVWHCLIKCILVVSTKLSVKNFFTCMVDSWMGSAGWGWHYNVHPDIVLSSLYSMSMCVRALSFVYLAARMYDVHVWMPVFAFVCVCVNLCVCVSGAELNQRWEQRRGEVDARRRVYGGKEPITMICWRNIPTRFADVSCRFWPCVLSKLLCRCTVGILARRSTDDPWVRPSLLTLHSLPLPLFFSASLSHFLSSQRLQLPTEVSLDSDAEVILSLV